MNRLSKLGIAVVFSLMATTTVAGDKMSQSELKQQALQMCTQSAIDTYGADAIVSVRKRVEWQQDSSRLNWHDGLQAHVRMIVWLDEEHLAKVMCSVDQKHHLSLTAVEVSPNDENGLLAVSQMELNN